MIMLPNYMRKVPFENWLEQSPYIERITDAKIFRLNELFATEEDCDSYAISPSYYAFTGRRGLWLYHYDGTYVLLCWHPNVAGQILVFPPRGKKDYAAITALLGDAPAPPSGFLLARFKQHEISNLKTLYAFTCNISFEQIEENILDWRYPARILSTLNTTQMLGRDYMSIRNRIRQTKYHHIGVEVMSDKHIQDIEGLAYQWAERQSHQSSEVIDLINPYKEILKLLRHKAFGLNGLVFIIDGRIQAATMWDISNPIHKIANLYMNLSNISCHGLSEFAIKATATKLCADGVSLLNLGGSETAGLDHFKNKFAPVLSIRLHSLKVSVNQPSMVAKTADVTHELRVA